MTRKQTGLFSKLDSKNRLPYAPVFQRCRKILIGSVVQPAETVVVRIKIRILTLTRNNPEMTVPVCPHADASHSAYGGSGGVRGFHDHRQQEMDREEFV